MKRKSNRAYYFPKPEPSALERALHALFGGGPLSPDYAERGLQLRFETANAPWVLLVGLAALGLGGFVYCLWKLIEAGLMLGPLGRIYGASHAVRRQLRKTRKSSTRKPPTPEALEAAWAKSRRSLEWKLRLGSMLEDLEPAVDQSYIRDDDGAVVGREPGIRGWLMEHCVEVFDHYKTAMGYKALAHRFRLAIDLPEPFTLEDVLDALSESIESIEAKEKDLKVITLCGSTRFKEQFLEAQKRLTLEGYVVLSVGLFGHSGDEEAWQPGTKEMLDNLHLRKIDMSDGIYVINVGGYIGESTQREIEYAFVNGTYIKYLEPIQ